MLDINLRCVSRSFGRKEGPYSFRRPNHESKLEVVHMATVTLLNPKANSKQARRLA